jgi:hypothetical protein
MKRTALLRRVGGINDWQSPRDDPAYVEVSTVLAGAARDGGINAVDLED